MFAIDIKTGKQVWGYDAKPHCEGERGTLVTGCTAKYGFSAAPLTVDGAVVAATLGGEVVIFDGKTGQVLKTLDTVGPKTTINGVAAKGGSIDAHGISAGRGHDLHQLGVRQLRPDGGECADRLPAEKVEPDPVRAGRNFLLRRILPVDRC